MTREIDFLEIPDNVRNLTEIGARAHVGKSGKYHKILDEVFNWKQVFGAGVTRINLDGTTTKAEVNAGGFPEIENRDGQKIIAVRTIHTHEETEFQADSVPVKLEGATLGEMVEYEDEMSEEVG